MDGGGRLDRPLTAGSADGAEEHVPTVRPSFYVAPITGVRPPRSARPRRFGPPARRLPRLFGTGLAFGFFGLVGATGAVLGGHYATFVEQHGELHHAVGRAVGLGIERVTISGVSQLVEGEILAAAGISPKISLAFLDAGDVRSRLEQVPLIRDAAVRKLYPNELLVTLTERDPFALWQKDGELFIVSADGTAIDRMRDGRFAHLPLVVGEGANGRTKEYLALLEAAGPLKSRIRAGTLVSGRRWTLKIDTGIDVRLPEEGATGAVQRLVKLEREQRILEKDVIAVDLRMADRIAVRLTEEAMAARADALKKKPMRGKGVET